MKPLILYKIHENYECDLLLKVMRYLFSLGFDVRPINVIEREFPKEITLLPTVVILDNFNNTKNKIEGINDILNYYEMTTGINNLKNKAITFSVNNSKFTISNRCSHKNIIYNK